MFNKFKALLLAGAMLVGVVSCADYDDDISGLSDRLDELEEGATVTVDDLATQLAAIELTIDDLAQLTETVEGVLADVEGVDGDVSDLTSSIKTDLAALEAELKSYVDGEITSLSETIAGIYATIESLNIVAARVAVLEAYCEGLGETTIAAQLAALQAQFDALDNTVASWTGEELLAYITAAGYVTSSQVLDYGYVTTADVEAMIEGLLDETAVKLIVESYGYMDLEAVKALSYLTSVDIEDFITEEALTEFLVAADLENYVQFEDIADFLTSEDISDLVTNEALAEALAVYSDYVSADALEAALKAYVTIEGSVSFDDLADFVTNDDLTTALAVYSDYVSADALDVILAAYLKTADAVSSEDLVDFVTNADMAAALAVYSDYVSAEALEAILAEYLKTADAVSSDDLADFITDEALEGYVTEDMISDFITENHLTGLIDAEELAAYLVAGDYATKSDVQTAVETYFSENEVDLSVYANAAETTAALSELSDAIASLKASLSDYALSTDLTTGLADLKTEISEILEDYATLKALEDYVTTSGLATELAAYTTTEDLTVMLAAYIAASESSMKDYLLDNYFTQVDIYGLLANYLDADQVKALIETYLADYYTSAQIDATLEDYVTFATLYTYLDEYDDMFETIYENIDDIEADVETIFAQLDQIFADMDEFKAEVAEEFSTVWSELSTISALQSAFMSYVMNDVFSGVLGTEVVMNEDGTYTVESTRLVAMEEKIYALQMQANATDEALTALANRVSDLESNVGDLQDDVAGLQDDVEDLQGDVSNLQSLVQSMVYVPAYLDEMNSVCFGKVGRFFWAANADAVTASTKVAYLPAYDPATNDAEKDTRLSLDLKFRMSPASALGEVTEDNYLNYITLLIEDELGMTRSVDATDEGAFELTGYKSINAETGEFYLTIKMGATTYPGKDDMTYAIALSVTDVTGTDYITDYIGIDTDYFDIYAGELAHTNGGTPAEAGVTDDYDTLLYTDLYVAEDDAPKVVFFDDYDTYALNSSGKYVLFSSLYDTFEYDVTFAATNAIPCNPYSTMDEPDENGAPYTGCTGFDEDDYFYFENLWTIWIYNVAPITIDDNLVTDIFTFTITGDVADGDSSSYKMSTNTIGELDILNDEMFFITENIGVKEEDWENRILSWVYGELFYTRVVDVSARGIYEGNEVEMTAQQFNATIGREGYGTSVIDVDLKLYVSDTRTLYDDVHYNENTIGFTAVSPVQLEWESDPQSAQVTFSTLPESDEYYIEVIYTFRDRTVIHVTVPAINIIGEPSYADNKASRTETFTFFNSDFLRVPVDYVAPVDWESAVYTVTYNWGSTSIGGSTVTFYDKESENGSQLLYSNNPRFGSTEPTYTNYTASQAADAWYNAYDNAFGYSVSRSSTAEIPSVKEVEPVTAQYYVTYDFSDGDTEGSISLDVASLLWNEEWADEGYYADYADFKSRILGSTISYTRLATNDNVVLNLDQTTGIYTVTFYPDNLEDPDTYPFGDTQTFTITVTGQTLLYTTDTATPVYVNKVLGTITVKATLNLPGEDVMDRIGGYFVSNDSDDKDWYDKTYAIAYLTNNNYDYFVADKFIELYFLKEGTASQYEIEFEITQTFPTSFTGIKPTIIGENLMWNDWNEHSLEITAHLYYYDIVSKDGVTKTEKIYLSACDKVFYVLLAEQIGKFEVVDLEIDASKGDQSVCLAEALTLVELVSGNSDNVFNATGLVESYASAFDATVTYEFVKVWEDDVTGYNNEGLLSFDAATGVVTYSDISVSVQQTIPFEYKVTYTYTYGTRTATVFVNLVP